jgi:hypothetical protein
MQKTKPVIIETPVLYISPNLTYKEICEMIRETFTYMVEAFIFGGHSGLIEVNMKIGLILNDNLEYGANFHHSPAMFTVSKAIDNGGIEIKIDPNMTWQNSRVYFNNVLVLIIQSDNILF